MKKIISLILCIVICALALVGCAEKVPGADKDIYNDMLPPEKTILNLNLYVIYEEGTLKNAYDTVQQRIESYTLTNYDTAVKVIYCSADEYETKVKAATKSNVKDKADIILINSADLFDELYNDGKLADLTAFIDSKEFGTLNGKIAPSLINSVKVKTGTETVKEKDEDGDEVELEVDVMSLFCIPNNRVVGNYEYLIINKEMARKYFYSDIALAEMTTLDSVAALKQKITDDGKNADDFVKVVKGTYGDRFKFVEEGYACNVVSVPKIDREYALSGAFAVLKSDEETEKRAMEIIFALNTDKTLHNYLQYGISPTNYIYDKENNSAARTKTGNSVYIMNPLYTGDIFQSYYCDELGWDSDAERYGIIQNNEAVFGE